MKRLGAIGIFVILSGLFCAGRLTAQGWHHPAIVSFEVGPDQTLNYPSSLANLPDEHTTFLPLFHGDNDGPENDPNGPLTYLVFGASRVNSSNAGAVVLTTTDLVNFDFATAFGYADQVFVSPVDFSSCDPTYDSEFDENYAAPGTVLQDPTVPPWNFIMLYEAENHCPGGNNQGPFYATIGFARSSDGGKTWPSPIDSEFGGPGRNVALKGPNPEPASESPPTPMGDAIPSAYLERNFLGESYLYVPYSYYVGPSGPSDGYLRVARAKLGEHGPGAWGRFPPEHLNFWKWHNGAFSEPGVGGLDTGVLPAIGCNGRQAQGTIYHNDDLDLYFLIYVCDSKTYDNHAAWFYSTATSLERQDWTTPQMVSNSRFTITSCSGGGEEFDGFYPSFMSPGAEPGHLRLTGQVFFLNGCDTGQPRHFTSRTYTITVGPQPTASEIMKARLTASFDFRFSVFHFLVSNFCLP